MGVMAAELFGEQKHPGSLPAQTLEEMVTLVSGRLPYFQRMALRQVDNVADAEDAVQDAFLSGWKHLDRFKGTAKMSTWLTVIVMNSARMIVRRRPRALHISIDAEAETEEHLRLAELLADANPDPEAQVRRKELELRLSQLSSHLTPGLREVIRLRGVEGMSIRETAHALGLTESAVKSRAARARVQLKELDQSYAIEIPAPGRVRNARRRKSSVPPQVGSS
jgi:RNA polymerase sigma-70 factor, ECF subfamily